MRSTHPKQKEIPNVQILMYFWKSFRFSSVGETAYTYDLQVTRVKLRNNSLNMKRTRNYLTNFRREGTFKTCANLHLGVPFQG